MSDDRQPGYGQQPGGYPVAGYPSTGMPQPGGYGPGIPQPGGYGPGMPQPGGPPPAGYPQTPTSPSMQGYAMPQPGYPQVGSPRPPVYGYAPAPGQQYGPQPGYGSPTMPPGAPVPVHHAQTHGTGHGPGLAAVALATLATVGHHIGYGPAPGQVPPAQAGYAMPPAGYAMPPAGYAMPRPQPTVVPAAPFDPVADAHALRKAMKGFGTNERALISILAFRTNHQRQEISQAFSRALGRNLIADIKSETSGYFEKILINMLQLPAVYDATSLYVAMEGLGTNETVLNEILATRTNQELRAVQDAYYRMYKRTLETDIKGDTSGDYKQFALRLLAANRDEGPASPQQAAMDARDLYNAGEARWGTTESTFANILGGRSLDHLRLVFQEYSKLSTKNMLAVIASEFSGDACNLYSAVVDCVLSKPHYIAKCLDRAMKGLGTADDTLIRLVISRCELDLGDAKTAYRQLFGRTLAQAVVSETGGDYKKTLLALLREPF